MTMTFAASSLTARRLVGKLSPETCAVFVCDMQTRSALVEWRMPTVVQTCRYILSVAHMLNMPILATQQHSKRYGTILQDVFPTQVIRDEVEIFEKQQFNMLTPQVRARLDDDERLHGRDSFLVLGIEAHACVQQTCLDLLEQGKAVHVVVDGVTSQQPVDRYIALGRLSQAGAFLTTAQSVFFSLLQTEEHVHFSKLYRLTMEHSKLPNEFNEDF